MATEYRIHEVLRDPIENNGEKHVAIYVIAFSVYPPAPPPTKGKCKKKKNLQKQIGYIESSHAFEWVRPSLKGVFQTLFFLLTKRILGFFSSGKPLWMIRLRNCLNVNRFYVRSTNDIEFVFFFSCFMASDFSPHPPPIHFRFCCLSLFFIIYFSFSLNNWRATICLIFPFTTHSISVNNNTHSHSYLYIRSMTDEFRTLQSHTQLKIHIIAHIIRTQNT